MPNGDFEQQSVNQSVVVSDSDSQEENSQQKPKDYWELHWEGNDILTLKTDKPLKDLQGMTVKTAAQTFDVTTTSHVRDWTTKEITLNQKKVRNIEIDQLLTAIEKVVLNELNSQNFNSTEEIKQFIETKLKELTSSDAPSKLISNFLDTFFLDEIKNLLNSFNQTIQTKIDNEIHECVGKNPTDVIKIILNCIPTILQKSMEIPLYEFFDKEIQNSGITSHIGLKNDALTTFIQQKTFSDTAQHILTSLFARYNEKYTPVFFTEQIDFYDNPQERKILGEITISAHAIACFDGTSQFKYLDKDNHLKSTMDNKVINPTNCKPLLVTKIKQSITPLEDDDARFDFLSYEIKAANNFDLNNIYCDAGLIPGFKNIMDELNSLDGSDGEAIFKFATNWLNYAYIDLLEESKIRTGNRNPAGDESIESLELIAKFYFQTNPEALTTFNKKIACLKYLNPWNDVSGYYLTVLESLHPVINGIIGKNSESDNLFTLNVAQRKEQFANFSGIIHSISEKLTQAHDLFNTNVPSDLEIDAKEHERYKQTNIYSLTCDFISLALTLEKLQLTKDLFKFKDFVHFEQYDGNALQGWKNIINIAKSNPGSDKEIISYLEKGVGHFESLINPNNAKNLVEVDNYVEGITETLKLVSSNARIYDGFKAHIIINPLAKQREFCENKFPQNVRDEFSEKLINIEDLMHKEAVEEFAAGKTLKQVARGKTAQICDKTTKLINTAVSQKSTAEKKAEIHKYKKETSALTTKEMIWSAIAAVVAAAISFIGGFSLARFAIKYGWFNYQAKQQSDKIARCADEFNAATEKQPQRSASIPSC